MKTFTPTQARKDLFKIAIDVNTNHDIVNVNNLRKPDNDMVIMSKSDYERMQETIHVLSNGQLQETLDRASNQNDQSFVDVTDGIDWDNL